jgi:predicted AlkP superfamily phosphohydrolase/phosphomutase
MILSKPSRFFLSLLAAVCLVPALSCRKAGPRPVMILGVDALDWEEVDLLRGQGLLPNIDRLIRTGVSATVETNDITGSAVYWTSIATGQTSAKHGITDFVYKDPQTGEISPVTSNLRRTKAFWNILSERDVPVGVVGWYVSWPAEPVKGFMVSSYFTWTDVQPTVMGTFYPGAPGMVYPESLAKTTPADIDRGLAKYKQDIRKIIPLRSEAQHGPNIIKAEWTIMSDYVYAEVGRRLLEKYHPRVFAVYFAGIDTVGHIFTRKSAQRQMHQVTNKFGDVQKRYYEAMDRMIEPFLAEAGDGTDIFLLADHGLMRGQHTHRGVCVLAGPDFRDGVRLEKKVRLTDVCPTLLYLLGLPVAEDMDGRVYLEAFEPDFVRAHRVETIATYGRRKGATAAPLKSNFDREIIDRLKTLGYLK